MKTNDTHFTRKSLVRFSLVTVVISLFIIQSFGQKTVITNPTSPWTVPANVTSIKVEVWGGGGGGGYVNAGLGTNGGGGGGGGAYNTSILTVTPGHAFTVIIGSGGTAGSGSVGGTGGTTTVTGTDGTVSATGGGGGGRGNYGNGSAGSASTGGFNNGGAGGASSGNGAGGGGGSGNATPSSTGNGGAGSNTAAGSAGLGSPNTAPYAGGIGAAALTGNGAGNPGIAPGGGGGGGRANFFGSNNGGIGGAGQVVITYCIPIAASVSSQSNISCFNGTDGSISLSASGGNSPYQFSIYNGDLHNGVSSWQDGADFNGLASGQYKIRTKDSNGCMSPAIP